MIRTVVVSSNVLSVGYDTLTQTLEVEFKDGVVYQYYAVAYSVYDGLMHAESVGRYLHQRVKQGGYEYDIVEK